MADYRRIGAALLAALSASLAGCTLGPDFRPPVAQLPAVWQGSPATPAADQQPWWHNFGDPVLDGLEERARAANLDLRIAGERLTMARIARADRRGEGMPQIGGELGYSRERIGTEGLASTLAPLLGTTPSAEAPKGYSFDLYRTGISAGWELDLWGKRRRLVEAATAGVVQAEAANRGARLAIEATVAQTYWQWRGLMAERALAERDLALGERPLAIAAALQDRGLASAIDMRQPQSEQRVRQDALAALDDEIGRAARALAVLTDGNPDVPPVAATEGLRWPVLAPPAPGLPSAFARRRPDIVEAEAALHAATAAIGAAEADFYPSLNLSGLFSIDVLHLADFGWDARSTSAGAALSIPIFAGGRLQRQLDARRAEERAAALTYRKVVLDAWREVDDALESVRALDQRRRLADAEEAARSQTLAAVEARYCRGDVAAASLIEAQAAHLAAERARLRQHIAGVLARIQLHVALGD